MILINKNEKEAVLKRFPDMRIARTSKQKSRRHRYYMEERPAAMRLLRSLRGHPDAERRDGRPAEQKHKGV